MQEFEPVIGLEVHAQLLTKSKLFCRCSNAFGAEPNTQVCPVCLGLPGALPAANETAIRLAVRAALALDCQLHEQSVFARKQYFYPDLPKGYQISQYERPYSSHGKLEFELDGRPVKVGITRVHLEEDAGKSVHGVGGDSILDLNRAGTPLIEIVSEPELHSSADAAQYLRTLREILVFLGVNDGNLEEGSFRCDANVSLRPCGVTTLGTRTELKNINSFRFVQRAIDVEIGRQAAILRAGGKVLQETRSYDPDSNTTQSLRLKDDAHDYRYFPDPDLPPLHISPGLVAEERAALDALPQVARERLVSACGLTPAAAQTLTQHPEYLRFFDQVIERFNVPARAANWILTEVLKGVKVRGLVAEFPVTPAQVAELLELVEAGQISGKQAKEVYAAVAGSAVSPRALVAERGLRVVSDEATLGQLIDGLLESNAKQVAAYRAGKTHLLGFFVGQVMRATRGSADPQLVNRLLTRRLTPSE